jgi:protein involved in polysaccharide export with SLBB domain
MRLLHLGTTAAVGFSLAVSFAAYAQEDPLPIVRVSPDTDRTELRVEPGGALRVQFACSPEIFESVINEDGVVTLGHLRDLNVAHLTTNELQSLLESRARDSLVQLVLRAGNRTWSLAPAAGTTCSPTGDFPDPTEPPSG